MPFYKITKTYRNARSIFYIKVEPREKVTDSMLHNIGELTEGGHAYGYTVTAEKVRSLPKNAKVLERSRQIKVY